MLVFLEKVGEMRCRLDCLLPPADEQSPPALDELQKIELAKFVAKLLCLSEELDQVTAVPRFWMVGWLLSLLSVSLQPSHFTSRTNEERVRQMLILPHHTDKRARCRSQRCRERAGGA
jgi:hypothetical protein